MSRYHPTVVEQAELAHPCLFCDQPAGAWCRTRKGRAATYLHADRWWQWRVAEASAAYDEHGRAIV